MVLRPVRRVVIKKRGGPGKKGKKGQSGEAGEFLGNRKKQITLSAWGKEEKNSMAQEDVKKETKIKKESSSLANNVNVATWSVHLEGLFCCLKFQSHKHKNGCSGGCSSIGGGKKRSSTM